MINLRKKAAEKIDELRVLERKQAIEFLAQLLLEVHDAGILMGVKEAKAALAETFAVEAPR
jgi:hypothetical protein